MLHRINSEQGVHDRRKIFPFNSLPECCRCVRRYAGSAAMSRAGRLGSMRKTIGRDVHVIMTGTPGVEKHLPVRKTICTPVLRCQAKSGQYFVERTEGHGNGSAVLHDVKRE